jgi:hypothetical protein
LLELTSKMKDSQRYMYFHLGMDISSHAKIDNIRIRNAMFSAVLKSV